MTEENKEKRKLDEIFVFCDKALEKAKNNIGMVVAVGFNGLNSSNTGEISEYLERKNKEENYFIMELENNNHYKAHIRYQKS